MRTGSVSIRHLVLGLLAQQPMSGYDIKRYLKSLNWLVDSPSFGSLYPTLRNLLQEGLVSVDIVLRKDKPSCKIYEITAEGRSVLQEWLDKPVAPEASLKTFVKRLVLAPNLSKDRLIADLKQRQAQVSAYQALLEGIAASLEEGSDPMRLLAIEYGLAMAVAETAWLNETLNRLAQQRITSSKELSSTSTEIGEGAARSRRGARTKAL